MASYFDKQTAMEENGGKWSNLGSVARVPDYSGDYIGDGPLRYGDEEDQESNVAPQVDGSSDRNAETSRHAPPSTPTVPMYSDSKATAQVSELIAPDELVAFAASMEQQAEHDLSLMLAIAFGHALVKAQQDSLLLPADPEERAVVRLTRAVASVMCYYNLGQFSKVIHGELAKLLPGYPPSDG